MQKNYFIALLYGWIVVLGIIFIASFILALLLQFTNFDQPTISWVSSTIGFIALFTGGIIAGAKAKARGWIIGGLTGVGFTLFTFLVQYLGYQQSFSIKQSLYHAGFILAAVLGGMIGVNLGGTSSSKS